MTRNTVAEIKDRLSIEEIINPYVKLKRAGRSLVGLCPFHKEKTPSFHVSPERGSWHCFGCGEGGDGFSFIEKVEGVDFKGALKILADKAGVTIEYSHGSNKEDQSKKERLHALVSRASEWYADKLVKSPAEAYAKKRGITVESSKAWRLGYAPEAWRALLEALTAEGFTIPEMLAAGLIKEADGKRGTYYDRFRNRLMFPIGDRAGRIVAFTGRALDPDESAKYLNSPETELYHKSEILFGIDKAKEAIRTRKFTMLVEGQMDVLLSHQAGFQNAVALSGTTLSPHHLSLMKRFSENLMLVLDADAAGLAATARSAELALRQGLRVKAASLPSGKDPADLITEDAKEFTKCIAAAKPIVEFFLAELSEREHDAHRLLRLVESTVLPLLSAISSPIERAHFIEATARTLGLSSEAVRESLAKRSTVEGEVTSPVSTPVTTEVRTPREVRGEMLQAVVRAYPRTPLAKRVKAEYTRITEAPLPNTASSEQALFEAERVFGENPSGDAADELLRAFEEAVIREAHQQAVQELRRAETVGDTVSVERVHARCVDLAARLAALGT